MKGVIKTAALEVFDEKGYHKAGIRDIAARAGCSLPTLYYYYGNKAELYTAVVCASYEELVEQISDQIPEGLPLREVWFFNVMQRRMLEADERRIFRLALKAMLGFERAGEASDRLLAFEKERRARERKRVVEESGDLAFARLVLRVTDQMLQSALLEDDDLDTKDIRREIDILFDAAPKATT